MFVNIGEPQNINKHNKSLLSYRGRGHNRVCDLQCDLQAGVRPLDLQWQGNHRGHIAGWGVLKAPTVEYMSGF